MGIFSRIKTAALANANDIRQRRDSSEKTEEEINEYLVERAVELAQIKKSSSELIAQEVKLERSCEECQAQIERFEELAKKALAAGSEEDARVFLKKKHELEAKKEQLDQKHDQAKKNADTIKQTYNAMVREINQLKQRLEILKGRETAADARSAYNRMSDFDVDDKLSQMERTVDDMQSAADAQEYSSAESDPLSQEIEKLRKQMKD